MSLYGRHSNKGGLVFFGSIRTVTGVSSQAYKSRQARKVYALKLGEAGGETITFGAGMEAYDGFPVERTIVLSEEPTHSVDLSQVAYDAVAGGFVWTAANASSPVTFYIRGIEWSEEPAEMVEEEPQLKSLPMTVSEHFIPAGYIGAAADIAPVECPADAMMDDCAGFAWNPSEGGAGWGGVIWQHPNGNWGRDQASCSHLAPTDYAFSHGQTGRRRAFLSVQAMVLTQPMVLTSSCRHHN